MSDLNVVSAKGSDIMRETTDANSVFNEIYDLTNKPVLAFITAKCGNTSDIGDIFQDTYMDLYKTIIKHGTDYITDSKALVFKIAKRKLAKYYSLKKRLQNFVTVNSKDNGDDDEYTELSDLEVNLFSMEDYAVNQIMLDNVRQLIKRKPEDVKKIFYLFYDMDMTISEIAVKLSLSESNVKNKLYRAIKEIKNLLE